MLFSQAFIISNFVGKSTHCYLFYIPRSKCIFVEGPLYFVLLFKSAWKWKLKMCAGNVWYLTLKLGMQTKPCCLSFNPVLVMFISLRFHYFHNAEDRNWEHAPSYII